ncbi:hypothetical protein MPDQ_007561 [Monascus purpureus]|uniref:Uncharacterized protein n=1 Tax=Monascus purpureus TaxID=5098 RepID=A0A507QS75_MONPU|nr:hypothetical protein MPDQ_007561 [Monascus purpureus]
MPRNWGAVDFVDFVDFMDFMDFMRQTATAPTVVYQKYTHPDPSSSLERLSTPIPRACTEEMDYQEGYVKETYTDEQYVETDTQGDVYEEDIQQEYVEEYVEEGY